VRCSVASVLDGDASAVAAAESAHGTAGLVGAVCAVAATVAADRRRLADTVAGNLARAAEVIWHR